MSEPRVLVWLLLEQDGALLLGRRKPERGPFAGLWTLPGDAMPEAESASETVGRIGREQLDLRLGAEEFFATLYLTEGDVEYAVNVFRVASYEGRPRFRESGPYAEVRWLAVGDLRDEVAYKLPEGLRAALTRAAERSSI